MEELVTKDSDFAMIVTLYGPEGHVVHVCGRPDPAYLNTCHMERHYRTLRMTQRRYTRKTDGYSKKIRNHLCAAALHFYSYNFVRPLKGGRTPAMAAGLTDAPYRLEELVAQMDARWPAPRRPTTYRKRIPVS